MDGKEKGEFNILIKIKDTKPWSDAKWSFLAALAWCLWNIIFNLKIAVLLLQHVLWGTKILGTHGHGVHRGQGRFWPFIKWTNITKQYLNFTTTLTSCKTWSWLLSTSCPWGLLLLLFSFFQFVEPKMFSRSRFFGHFSCWQQRGWVGLGVTSQEISKPSCRIQDPWILFQKPFSLKRNGSLWGEYFCMFFSNLSDFERIIFIINLSVSKAERFCLQMSLSWYQFLCNSSPTSAFSSQQVQWVLYPFLLKVKWDALKFWFEPYIIEFPFPRNVFMFLNCSDFLKLRCEKGYKWEFHHKTLQHHADWI